MTKWVKCTQCRHYRGGGWFGVCRTSGKVAGGGYLRKCEQFKPHPVEVAVAHVVVDAAPVRIWDGRRWVEIPRARTKTRYAPMRVN